MIPISVMYNPGSQPPAITAPAPVLTLEQAIDQALAANPTIQGAEARVTEAQGRVREAAANYRPAFTVSASATGLDRTQRAGFALPGLPPISFTTNPKDTSQATIATDVPLDVFGQIRRGVRLARVGKESADFGVQAVRNQVGVQVREAYFQVLQAQELVKVAEEAVRNAEAQERTAAAYVQAGTATRFDILRAATGTAAARQNLLTARNRVTLALAALQNVLGLSRPVPFVVAAPALPAEESIPAFETALAQAEAQRPELLQAVAGIRAAEAAVQVAAASDDPTLGVGAQYQRSPRPGFGASSELGAVSVRMTIPLYDRGIANARVEQTKAQVTAARKNYEAARNNVALEVRQALLNEQEALDRQQVAITALAQAEEQYRLAQKRYEAGINLRGDFSSPQLEILDAQTALTQAQTNAVNSRFDVLIARARRDGALGRYGTVVKGQNSL